MKSLNIIPDPPCDGCYGACCTTTQDAVVELDDDEAEQLGFVLVEMFPNEFVKALPITEDGKCVHLKDGRCGIYEKRPKLCREYNCLRGYSLAGRLSFLLEDHPQVVQLIRTRYPDFKGTP